MKIADLEKRIAELEAEIAKLKAQPRQVFEYHYHQQPVTYTPHPWYVPQYPYIIYGQGSTCGGTTTSNQLTLAGATVAQ